MPSTRLCLDANVALHIGAVPRGAIVYIARGIKDGELSPVFTHDIDQEYTLLSYRKSIRRFLESRHVSIQQFTNQLATLRARAELITVSGEAPLCRDPKDRKYLHCVRDGQIPYLVTRDKDLLESTAVPQTRILTPEEFVRELNLA